MGAHNDTANDYAMFAGGHQTIANPGTGNTLALNGKDRGIATLSAGTYKLPANIPAGITVYVLATGSVTIQNSAAATVGTLTTNQIGIYQSRGSSAWVALGPGATNVSVTDANSYTTYTTAEAWLNEVAASQRLINVDLARGILADGTPLAAFADNAGAPAPGITLANSKAVGIRWNNQATQNAPVWFNVPITYQNFDTSSFLPRVRILASKTGATVGDATTFTVTAFGQRVGSLHDADSDLISGASTAMTGNATAKTVQEVYTDFTEQGGSFPALKTISLSITPTSGTLGTDDVIIHRLWMTY